MKHKKKPIKKAIKVKKKETRADDHEIIVRNKTRKATHPARERKNTKSKAPSDRRQENQQLQKKNTKKNNNNNVNMLCLSLQIKTS